MNRPFCCVYWLTLALIVSFSRSAPAQISFLFPTGARSYGLGETGVADAEDPANVYYNPAILFTLREAHLSIQRTDFPSLGLPEVDLTSLGVGGGYEVYTGAVSNLGVGIDLRYTKLDLGERAGVDNFERYFGVSAAAGWSVNDRYYIGAGASIKPFKIRSNTLITQQQPVEGTATIFDLGFLASARLEESTGAMIISIGVSGLNLGGDVELEGAPFVITSELPEEIRAGLGLRFVGLPHEGLTRALGNPVPAFSIAINFDFEKPQVADIEIVRAGFEVGILSLVYPRVGFLDTVDTGFSSSPAEVTYGVGLAFPGRRFQARFDYARFKPGSLAINRFGGTVAFLY